MRGAPRGGQACAAAALALALAGVGCRRDPARDDAAALVESFDAVMRARGAARTTALSALRALRPTTPAASSAQVECLAMFDALAEATELEDRLAPMANDLEALARADAAVPVEVQRNVIALYHEAESATREAELALPRCVERVDGLRLRARRR